MTWRHLLPMLALVLPLATGCLDAKDDDDDEERGDDSGGVSDDPWSDTDTDGPGGTDVDGFVDAYAAAICDWATECGLLDVFGGTPAACIEMVSGQVEGAFSSAECDYDPVAAQQCLDGLSRSTCDAPYEDPACAEICGGGDE
jgi:hypothetical protein